jgi:hypothetical protein
VILVRSVRLGAVILALSGVGLAQTPALEIVSNSVVDRSFPAMRDGHRIGIESRSLQFRSSDGAEIAVRELVLLREPFSGQALAVVSMLRNRFGTYASAGDLLENTAISVDKDALRAFFFLRFTLIIQESKTRYASIDAAQERAVADFLEHSHPVENWFLWPGDGHEVLLWEQVPKSLVQRVADLRLPPTHLRDLAHSGRCWSMTLDGPNAESTRIIVDDNYDLTNLENCDQPRRTVSHVRIVPASQTNLEVPALRNNRQTSIELHSKLAQVIFPDGQTGRLHLFMLYDPGTRLFWWTFWSLHPTQPDSVVETDTQQLLRNTSIYIAEDRIAYFSGNAVRDSTERYRNFQAAETHVLSVLENLRGNIQAGRGVPYRALDTSGIPRGFFQQCMHAEAGIVQLTRVAKVGALWQLTLLGANGNSAVLSLNANYETLGVQLSPNVAPATIERVVRSQSVAAQREGRTINLELRELQIRHPSDCGGSTVSRAALIFDPSTHLSWSWRDLQFDEAANLAIRETEDSIVVFSAAMPNVEVRESIERHSNWNEFQSHILKLSWQGLFKGYKVANLSGRLPEEFLRRSDSIVPTPLQVSRANGIWRILLTGAKGQTAIVELDDEYEFVRANLQP